VKHLDSLDARNFRDQARHARACSEHSCLAKGSGATGVRQAGFTRTSARERSVAATPLSASAAVSASGGPEALRHRLTAVLPLFRRNAVCSKPRDVTYRAAPHRNRVDSGKEVRVNDERENLSAKCVTHVTHSLIRAA